MTNPSLSIIIPAYNVEAFIIEAVQSALKQTFTDLEIIVVDDGSTDRTLEKISLINDERLRIVRQSNSGLSGAKNTGLRHARGDYVGFLDGDDAWLPERAAQLVQVLESDPEIGVVYSHYAYIDENGTPTGQIYGSKILNPSLRQMVRRNHAGSSVIARRVCLISVGMFDETLKSCEDYELWIRVLASTSFKMQLVPRPLALYRVRSDSLTVNFKNFLANADLAINVIRTKFPNLQDRDVNHGWADCYRIASRKALSSGRLDLAREHMWEALKIFPPLPFVDHLAFGTLVLVCLGTALPKKWEYTPYQVARVLMRRLS